MRQDKLEQYKQVLNSGELYDCSDGGMLSFQHELVERLNRYNRTPETPEGLGQREEILKEALGTYGEGLCILPPVYANWGLKNLHVGRNVFFNFNVCLVDDADIFLGDDCLIGPGCHLVTAQHPVSPGLRKKQLQFNKPIHIGNNVWLGAGVIVLPGVRIGDNTVVGAGSVVTRDLPADVVAVGTPCRVLRAIGEEDRRRYFRDREIDGALLE